MSGADSYAQETDVSHPKSLATAKYNNRRRAKSTQIRKESLQVDSEYNDLVESIKELRRKHKDTTQKVAKLEKLKQTRKRLKKLASCQLLPSIKTYGNQLLDGLHAVIQYVETIREVVGEDMLKFLLDLFTTLYNIYKRPTWDSALVNASSFFLRNFPKEYAEYAIEWFKAAFEVATCQKDGDSIKDTIIGLFTNCSEFLEDALWANLSDFFVKIAALYGAVNDAVSLEALDLTTTLKKFKAFKATLPEMKDLIEMAFAAYEFVLGSWENIRSGDWSKILLGKDETKEFEIEVRVLEQAFPLVLANQEIELLSIHNLTPKKFETRLTAAIKHSQSLIHRCSSVQQRMSVSNFVRTLTDKQTELYARMADAPRRDEPYSLKLSGPSSCGKSTLVNILSRTVLNAYGYDPNERGQVVFTNLSEKYESTIKPSHKIIVADDMANNINEKPNYDRILNYVNTVPRPLEKADTKEKGILYPGNCAFIGTTNDETLRAQECSACPESILRRFALDVEVRVREQFRNAYGGLIRLGKPRYDVYELVLKRFNSISEEGQILWDIIPRSVWNNHPDADHDFAALTKFISQDVLNHVERVQSQARAQEELDDCKFCTECGCPSMLCFCTADKTTPPVEILISDDESLEELPPFDSHGNVGDIIPIVEFSIPDDGSLEGLPLLEPRGIDDDDDDDESTLGPLVRRIESDDDDSECTLAEMQIGDIWTTFSTAELWDVRTALRGPSIAIVKTIRKGMFYTRVWKERNEIAKVIMTLFGAIILGSLFSRTLAQVATFAGVSKLILIYQKMISEIDAEISRRGDQLSSLCHDTREHLRENMTKYFAAGAAIITIYKCYQMLKPMLGLQDKTSYFPEISEKFKTILDAPPEGTYTFDIQDQRDYKEGYSRLTPKETQISKTTTSADLQIAVAKALRVVIVKSRGQVYGTVNGIMVESNVIMVPAHIVPYTFPFDIETSSTPGVPSASTKDQKLTEDFCSIDRERDVAFIHLASSPASTNFTRFFPEELPEFYGRTTTLLWKSPSNEVIKSTQVARQMVEDLPYGGFLEHPGMLFGERKKLTILTLKKGAGMRVDLEFPGFGGLCGGMYVDSSKGIIYGFHVAGYPRSHSGFFTCVTKPQIEGHIDVLRKTSPTLVVHSCTTPKVDAYGTPFTLVNSKPLYLREDGTKEKSTVTFLGSVLKDGLPLEARARSPYVKTPFIGVEEALGPSKHKPPTKPNSVEKGMKTLNKLTNPVQHYEGDILMKAVNDYKNQTLKVIRENKEEAAEMLRLYTQEEAMDGTGDFGLGGLPSSTSAGFPINKSKKHCLVRDPMDESNVAIPREFNDNFDIQAEIDRTEECWRNNERSETIFKASSKVNELLPNEKATEKVRKFYGSGFASSVASKKALAGIPRFMKKYWKETECLVGIDPLSKEWADFHDFVTEYSVENMIDGDFAGFDTRMAAQITGAASKILEAWYEEVGTSEEDMKMIRGALSDIIHPNILFDGDLYRFANGNPSGNIITVQLNSICNSIMMRYVYYAMMPNVKQTFSENVRLGTYGDDNAMSVKHHCKWYNHTSCQAEFAKLDISYTMADKDAKSVPYIPVEKISFLKRSFVRHETLNTIVAPIEEDSIFKKFHYIKKPNETPLTPEEQFGAYTDGSFREAYLHGQVYYDNFLGAIRTIVDKNPQLKHHVAFITYEEMTLTLSPPYRSDYVNDNKKLYADSCGVPESENRE